MLQIAPGAHGPRAFHAVQLPAGVRRRAARGPGEPDVHETVRETADPLFEGASAGRADEDPPVGKQHLHFHPGFRAIERNHHPVAMKLQFIGPAVDPLDIRSGQKSHKVPTQVVSRIGANGKVPAVLPADEPYSLATAGMPRSV